MAKAAYWTVTDAEARKRGEQTGLDTDPMPELPEVETIARTLAPQVEGRRIVACELLNPSTFEGTIPLGKVVGGVIGRPGRRGKLLHAPL